MLAGRGRFMIVITPRSGNLTLRVRAAEGWYNRMGAARVSKYDRCPEDFLLPVFGSGKRESGPAPGAFSILYGPFAVFQAIAAPASTRRPPAKHPA